MKTSSLFFSVLLVFSLMVSCKKEDPEDLTNDKTTIVPKNFTVEIPDAISSADMQKAGGPLQGNEIYENLRTFIHVGAVSAAAVNTIITTISQYGINEAMNYSYTSNEDSRLKNIVVTENVTYGPNTWEFEMIIDDQDGETGLQVLWNTNPVKGIAVLSPYNMNRNQTFLQNAMFKVEYSEAGEQGYDKQMIVSISGYPVTQNNGIDNLKMFVGKTGTNLDIAGNSNHPVIVLLDTTKQGLNWAFVANADASADIAMAKVALTPCTLQDTANMYASYSIYNVLNQELHWKFDPLVDNGSITSDSLQSILNWYLQNTAAPAYFKNTGFVSCNPNIPTSPAEFSSLSYTGLMPYVPKEISEQDVTFYNTTTK